MCPNRETESCQWFGEDRSYGDIILATREGTDPPPESFSRGQACLEGCMDSLTRHHAGIAGARRFHGSSISRNWNPKRVDMPELFGILDKA